MRRISAGVSCLVCIVVEPSSCHCHEIRYQKYLCSERLLPVLNSLHLKSWAIASMCLLSFCTVLALVKSWSCERHMRAVLFTYVSPILSMPTPVGVVSLKQVYLLAIYHSKGLRTANHMDGEAQLPWPVPSIRLREFDIYALAERLWPVLSLQMVLLSIVSRIFASVLGRPILR